VQKANAPELRVLAVHQREEDFERTRTACADVASRRSQALSLCEESTLARARARLLRFEPDCVICDAELGDDTGLDLALPTGARKARPLIAMLSEDSVEAAVAALRRGAHDALPPSQSRAPELARALRLALERTQEQSLLAEANARLEKLAMMDALTETYNRFGLERFLRVETGRSVRSGTPLHALVIDCDDFKSVNDRYGHAGGDAVLVEIARRISRAVRAQDCVARIGGDEFAVLLPDTRMAEAVAVAERVRLCIRNEAIEVGPNTSARVTCSLAAVEVQPSTRTVTDLLALAGKALRCGKEQGKDQVVGPAGPSKRQSPDRARTIVTERHRVRERSVMRLADGAPVARELWVENATTQEPHTAELLAQNMDSRERSNADLAMFKLALKRAKSLQISLAYVHLLPSTLLLGATERVRDCLAVHLPASASAGIVLSDQQILGDPTQLLAALEVLRGAGCHIVLDEMGFGRNALESMIALSPHAVRLHPRLVAELDQDPGRCRLVERLVRSVRALDIDVIAAGVTRREETAVLQRMGVTHAQGPLFELDRPLPAPI
jgi:diguanylate cyclase (GGDEF)-like protein